MAQRRRSLKLAWIHPQASEALCISLLAGGFVLTSALAVVFVKHIHRHKVQQLYQLTQDRDALQNQWSQLLVEHSSTSALDEIERAARLRLGMRVPTGKEIAVLQPRAY
jgi:cell division protein FtsL